jgi:hypothetical protein
MTGTVIITDNNTAMNVNKVYAQHEQVVIAIESPINKIFDNYYKQNTIKMIGTFNSLIAEKITDPTILNDIQNNIMANFIQLF